MDRAVAESGRHAAGSPGALREDVVIRRTSAGWRVEGSFPSLPTDTVDELGNALALADLLAEGTIPGPRPPRPADGLDEVARLRASVRQLEHALASRVVVEQAIGVLTERWRVAPRDAFEQLRRITRSRGLRIHDLARQVIESCTDPDVRLPAELVPVPRPAGTPPEPRQSPDRRVRRRRRRATGVPACAPGARPGRRPAGPRWGASGSAERAGAGRYRRCHPRRWRPRRRGGPVRRARRCRLGRTPNGSVGGQVPPADPATPARGRHARVER